MVGALATPAVVTTATAQEANASLTYDDQTATDNVTVQSATLPDGGFVVVYNSSGAVVGTTDALDAGTHENLTVNVTPPFAASGVSFAEIHRDNDSDGSFNATVDTAYNTSTGNAISSTAYITVEDGETTTEATETTEETTESDTETTTVAMTETTAGEETTAEATATGGPGFTLVGALVAVVAAALLARRT
ncbi:hypothetical protein K933_08347 [Candidatus Halobonum tyrrellensis G22]|uniref:DUF7282 domain-containing protein n=1 Tax=Candidatus Halobonum tyrrellensis G22 TaxID=1324957 RepID=V4HCN0_9EURY|nr:hypothetical protein K933_08347 [Candidatus Halobonum tyrrellensis G22]